MNSSTWLSKRPHRHLKNQVNAPANARALVYVPGQLCTPGLNVQKDMHMHGATYTFIDANHFRLEGVSWKDAKAAPCGAPAEAS